MSKQEKALIEQLLSACKALQQEVEEFSFEAFDIVPHSDDESEGAKLGRIAIETAEKMGY